MGGEQQDLFGAESSAAAPTPEGFRYAANVLTVEQERAIVEAIRPLPFKEFAFHGYLGKRRVVSFGWKYDYTKRSLEPTREIPDLSSDRSSGCRCSRRAPFACAANVAQPGSAHRSSPSRARRI